MVKLRHLLPLPLAFALAAQPASARPFGAWGDPFDHEPLSSGWRAAPRDGQDSREGKVEADSFMSDGAQARLGHGSIDLVTFPEDAAVVGDQPAYQAAVIDQLVKAGYDTQRQDEKDGQVVELRFRRDTLVPEEPKRKPVSGETGIAVSNRGTAYGMAIAIDLSKPKKALISTRMDARIKDRATGATLWEGHATMAARDGDSHWTDQAIATRLASALFDGFPDKSTTVFAAR